MDVVMEEDAGLGDDVLYRDLREAAVRRNGRKSSAKAGRRRCCRSAGQSTCLHAGALTCWVQVPAVPEGAFSTYFTATSP